MIPKKIHYIWLGGNPLPKIAEKCIESWKKYCPDYEIVRWDESNVDVDFCKYCRQAYDSKKFAFASDALRFDILAKHGGIYLDIDVELLKSLDELLNNRLISGFENEEYINPGVLLGAEPNNEVILELVEEYKSKNFETTPGMKNQVTVCTIFSNKIKDLGLVLNNTTQEKDGVKMYSTEYFCPKSMSNGKIYRTENTYSIHHYASTWVPKRVVFINKCKQLIKRIIGKKMVDKLKQKREKNNEKSANKCDSADI